MGVLFHVIVACGLASVTTRLPFLIGLIVAAVVERRFREVLLMVWGPVMSALFVVSSYITVFCSLPASLLAIVLKQFGDHSGRVQCVWREDARAIRQLRRRAQRICEKRAARKRKELRGMHRLCRKHYFLCLCGKRVMTILSKLYLLHCLCLCLTAFMQMLVHGALAYGSYLLLAALLRHLWSRLQESHCCKAPVRGCLRGGGLDDGKPCTESEQPSEIPDAPLVLQDMDSYTGLVQEAGLSGMARGSSYTAARTRGDGTCGLHALFGACAGGELYAASVRLMLQQLLPKDLATVLANASVNGRRALGEALEQLLRDVMPIGRKVVEGGELQDESLLLWRALPAHVREDVLALATMKQHERANDAQLLEQLKKLFREIFIPAHAESLVRILCIMLDYILPSAPLELLSMAPETPELQTHEGQRGSLELLHPCAENPTLTKYQALFNPDVLYDRYRIAFFMNAANQHASQDWLLDAVDSTSQLLADNNP